MNQDEISCKFSEISNPDAILEENFNKITAVVLKKFHVHIWISFLILNGEVSKKTRKKNTRQKEEKRTKKGGERNEIMFEHISQFRYLF